ncbi:MAG: transketolase [Planctomycetota bacterium]|nr:transketolase [Planctomycetota bacterium]
MARSSFDAPALSDEHILWHQEAVARCRRAIIQMTSLAASGHPGGSLSSLDVYLVLWACARVEADNPWMVGRDRIVVSHGHTSPGVYSVLAELGFIDGDEAIASFRSTQNIFEGHIERDVPGVEWTTGNLGQGLSAACGMILGERIHGRRAKAFVPMGDGEQQKGQISEARRFAVKFGLNEITAIIDRNRLQIGGDTEEIMPQQIVEGWEADGWRVVEIDGHDPKQIFAALKQANEDDQRPWCIVAHTVMGKGISFMENLSDFHGRALKPEELAAAVEELGEDPVLWDMSPHVDRRNRRPASTAPSLPDQFPVMNPGTPVTYGSDERTDCRSAFGKAIHDVALATDSESPPIAAFDCDLEGSVKLGAFHKSFPDHFFQSGIQEHHTATCAGALSTCGVTTVFADFGVFGVCETYNQHRLSDINHAHLKIACTHLGLDVGEDGRTHQCIDYVGILRNIFGMTIFVPADPNQTDRIVRHALTTPGMAFIGMGRSKLSTITDEDGAPFFAGDYQFEPGTIDFIRTGNAGMVISMGTPTGRALEAVDALRAEGLDVSLAHVATPAELDRSCVQEIAGQPFIVTIEDHSVRTGLGNCIAEALFDIGTTIPHLRLGVENYAPSGPSDEVYRHCGLDTDSIKERVQAFALERQ